MKSNPCDPVSIYSVSKLTVLLLLASALGVVLPHSVQAQRAPPPASAPHCVTCGARISLTKGCPNCSHSGNQKTKHQHAHTQPIQPMWYPFGPYYRPPQQPTDYRVYYDENLNDQVKPTTNDPKELAETIAKLNEQDRKKKEEAEQSLDKKKNDLLKGVDPQKLNNPFANDPSVVDLRHVATPTPSIKPMGDSKPSGAPIYEADLNPLKALSDEQLEKKRVALSKAISEVAKLQAAVTRGYDDLESDAQAGKELAWKAFGDAYATATFGASGEIAGKYSLGIKTYVKTAADSADAITLGDTLLKRSSDPSSVKDGDDFAQALTVGSGLMKSGVGKVPGAVQSGIDTGFVWANYWKQACESSRQEELQKQHNANLLRLSLEQTRVIEEQNRRKRAGVSN